MSGQMKKNSKKLKKFEKNACKNHFEAYN